MGRGKDDAPHSVAVHCLDQVGKRLLFDIDAADDIHADLLFRCKRLLQRSDILGQAS